MRGSGEHGERVAKRVDTTKGQGRTRTMTASTVIAGDAAPGLLSRERIIAKPGFNRWLVPPAALCIHLCIGMAYGFSVFWKPLQGALARRRRQGRCRSARRAPSPSARSRSARSRRSPPRAATGASSTSAGCTRSSSCCSACRPPSGAAGSSARAAQSRPRLRALLVRRPADRRLRRLHPPAVADVARRRRHRRHRPRARLHLAGLDAHQMVPRPARHGHRHGHHGLRRRRHDRLAARDPPDEPLQDADRPRRLADVRRDGRHLLRVHADRRLRLSAAARRLEARRLDAADQRQRA